MNNIAQKLPDEIATSGEPGFVYVQPLAELSAKTRPITRPGFDPVAAAEAHMKRVSAQFSYFLGEQEAVLRTRHRAFKQNPKDAGAYKALKAIVHEIKGNAPLLGSSAAGALAAPMATAMERCTGHRIVQATFDLVVSAICSALRGETSEKDEAFADLIATLDKMNARCELSKTSDAKNKITQAAGSASREG